jgi:cytochrome c
MASMLVLSTVASASAITVLAAVPVSLASTSGLEPHTVGDAVRGAAVYQVCTGCHSLDEDDVGPHHRGVVGRVAGAIQGYPYSPALKASGVVWTPEALDRWLQNPQAFVPGTKMFFALMSTQDRADVIAYLAEQR